MTKSITILPVGTKFNYNGLEYEVTSRDQYPFIEAKCLTEPNDYEGHNILFWNFEKVEVADDTKVYVQTFVSDRHGFHMEETLS